MSGSGIGIMSVYFDLGTGASFGVPRGRGELAISAARTAQSNCGTNGWGFGITGVKLEIGAVATPYNRQSLVKSLADCQRYYQTAEAMADCFPAMSRREAPTPLSTSSKQPCVLGPDNCSGQR